MSDKLVKEIITTTTERFGDNGSIKEKVTESREKIYEYGYTEKQIAEAKVIKPEKKEAKSPAPAKDEKQSKEELIKEVAKNIDSKAKKSDTTAPSAPATPSASPSNPYEAYLAKQPAVAAQTKFPWEEGK